MTSLCSLSPTQRGYYNISDKPYIHHEITYNYLSYNYKICHGFAVQVMYPHIRSPGIQCVCRPHISIAIIGVILSLIGIALNSSVVSIYHRRKEIQKKSANLLLVHQAVVDLVNCAAYVFFRSMHTITLYPTSYKTMAQFFYPYQASGSLGHLSCTSSILTFTLIAFERCFAIAFPIKHRKYLEKSWINIAMAFI